MPVSETQKLTLFLAFRGDAEDAVEFYTSLFKDSEMVQIVRARPEDPGWVDGTLQHAIFTLAGQQFMCVNIPPPDNHLYKIAPWHEFNFNPGMTIYVHANTEDEFDRLYEALSEKGEIYLPAASYGFSPKFAWLNDRYGISWRINLSSNSVRQQ
jgi:predicted 3-demethylubiquinone-9 3-methyltransferase (glyoxalase superfamily)